MIFHITRATARIAVAPALELGKQFAWRLAEQVHQHIETSTMRHPDHDIGYTALASALHDLVQQRNQRVGTLQGKSFLAHVAPMQKLFEPLRGRQVAQGIDAHLCRMLIRPVTEG